MTETIAPASGNSGSDTQDALASVTVAEGLAVTLFASEPDILSISNIDIDARGRVWACEVVNYRHNKDKRPEGDRILILEDINGDGKSDKTTVFYQGHDIDSAHGICVLGDRVIVSCGDQVFILSDTDGDDKADDKEILFTGISGTQHDHGIHAFVFGPDGKLYFNFGNAGMQIKDKNGKPIVDMAGYEVNNGRNPYQDGMVFRCNLDGSEFETLAWNFRNNWEVTVDSFGTIWQSDNDDDGNRGVRINYVMEFGNYGYKDEFTGAGWRTERTGMHEEIPLRHWHLRDPGVVPNLLQTGAGSPSGITIYEGSLLPRVFHNQVMHAEPGRNVVRAYPVTPDGAGYKAEVVNILHSVTDKWFRPVDVAVAPDGSIIIADWYDPGVGGHGMGDIGKGRLYRIAPADHRYDHPKFDFSSARVGVEALKNPNFAVRYLAWSALHKIQGGAESALLELWRSSNPRYRARALWLLGKIKHRGEHYVQIALKDGDPNIRIVGLRLARQLKFDIPSVVEKLVDDPDPKVRRECAIALRHQPSPQAAKLWAQLAIQHDGKDRWYLEALGIGADKQWDRFFQAYLDTSHPHSAPASKSFADIVWRSRSSKALPYLVKLIQTTANQEDRLRYFRGFDFHTGSEKNDVLAKLITGTHQDQIAINAVAFGHLSDVNMSTRGDLKAALERTLDSLKGTGRFVELVSQFNIMEYNEELLSIALNNSTNDLGVDAIRCLIRFKEFDLIKETLFSKDTKNPEQLTGLLGMANDQRADGLLAEVAGDDTLGLPLRNAAVVGLGKNGSGEKFVLGLVEEGQLPLPLHFVAANVLFSSRDKSLKTRAAEFLEMPKTFKGDTLPPIKVLAKRRGDAEKGKMLYLRACMICHKMGDIGIEFGPSIEQIGGKLARDTLYRSILDPSAAISFGYEGFIIALKDGNKAVGYVTSETDDSLSLRVVGGLTLDYKKSDIFSKTALSQSLMTANLQATMTSGELIDLVEYLTTLK